jgi:dTDP-glucose pyrophosphorylase
MISTWRKTLVTADASIREAMAVLDAGAAQIALVVDDQETLLGVVTDGDIRRGILRGIGLDGPVGSVMRRNCITVTERDDQQQALTLMRIHDLKQVPVVDSAGRVVGLHVLRLARPAERGNWVLLMVGGQGQRLRPFTDVIPKPLLPMGGRALLETIIEKFVTQGFRRFYLAVNYKAEMVQMVVGDGSRFGAHVEYIRETEALGTAGALGLLPEPPDQPLIVMNGDLLTKVDFNQVLEFHAKHGGAATMAVREHRMQIPYGVVEVEGSTVTRVVEKPVQTFLVNAGIYVLDPAVVAGVARQQRLDMPDLISRQMAAGAGVHAFPIREYWADIGTHEDFDRASAEFTTVFQK